MDDEYSFEGPVTDSNVTQESLTEDAKALFMEHPIRKAAEHEESCTPVNVVHDYGSSPTGARNICGSASNLTSPLITKIGPPKCASADGLARPQQRVYYNVLEMREENNHLRSEIFALKTQLFVLKRDLPEILDNDGKDIVEKCIELSKLLHEERTRRMEEEQVLKDRRSQLDEQIVSVQKEKLESNKERDAITAENAQLISEIDSLRQRIQQLEMHENYESNDDQGDNSDASVMSANEADRLRLAMHIQKFEDKKQRDMLENSMKALIENLNQKISESGEELIKEQAQRKAVEVEIAQLKEKLNEMIREGEILKQGYEQKMMESKKVFEEQINGRNKAIRALSKKLKLRAPVDDFEDSEDASHSKKEKLHPAAEGLMDKIEKARKTFLFESENRAIKKKLLELDLGEDAIFLDDDIGESEIASLSECSTINTEIGRINKMNRKMAEFLAAKNAEADIMGESLTQRKLSEFDRNVETLYMSRTEANATFVAQSSVVFSDLLDVTSASAIATEDLNNLKKKLPVFQSSCVILFDTLREAAICLEAVLEEMGSDDRVQEVMNMIKSLTMNVNCSSTVVDDLRKGLNAAEKSIGDLTMQLEKSFNHSINTSNMLLDQSKVEKANQVISELNNLLEIEKQKSDEFEQIVERTAQQFKKLEVENQKYREEIEKTGVKFAEQTAEMRSTIENQQMELRSQFEKCAILEETVNAKNVQLEEVIIQAKEEGIESKNYIERLEQTCEGLKKEKLMVMNDLAAKESSIEKLRKNLDLSNHSLKERMNELTHYKMELIDLDGKLCDAIATIKISLGIIVEERSKKLLSELESEAEVLNQFTRIDAEVEELMRLTAHIEKLKGNLFSVKKELGKSIDEKKSSETVVKTLKNENNQLRIKFEDYSLKVEAAQQRLESEQKIMRSNAAEIRRLKEELACAAENNKVLSENLVQTEANMNLITADNRFGKRASMDDARPWRMDVSTSTNLSGCNIEGMKSEINAYKLFVDGMHKLVADWSHTQIDDTRQLSVADLGSIHQKFVSCFRCFKQEIADLRNEMKTNNQYLGSIEKIGHRKSDEIQSHDQKTSTDSLVNMSGSSLSGSNSSNVDKNELIQLRQMFKIVDDTVQQLKSVPNKTNLHEENERLKQSLVEAHSLLEEANEKLKEHPDSANMRKRIIGVLLKISKAMTTTSKNVSKVQQSGTATSTKHKKVDFKRKEAK